MIIVGPLLSSSSSTMFWIKLEYSTDGFLAEAG